MKLEPTITEHAKLRFTQRFPELDFMQEWSTAVRGKGLNRKIWKHIKAHSPVAGPRYMATRAFHGVYYKLSKGGVVFVVKPPMQVVTVIKVPQVEAMKSETPWVKVPGTEDYCVRKGKIRSDQLEAILNAGNALHAYVRDLSRFELEASPLAKAWIEAVSPRQ